MKKKTIIIIVIVVVAILSFIIPQDEEKVDTKQIVTEHFQENNFMEVDDIAGNDISITFNATDMEAADAAISLYSDNLAKKLQDHQDSLTLIYALPKLGNVCEVRYEKQDGKLVQVYFEYDI